MMEWKNTSRMEHSVMNKYARPPINMSSCLDDDLEFQLLDITQTKIAPNPAYAKSTLRNHQEVPEIRLYGLTRTGISILVQVMNVEPYLWIEAPRDWSPQLSGRFMEMLNQNLAAQTRVTNTVVRIETHSSKRSLMHYQSQSMPFLKIYTQLPGMVPKLRSLLSERGVQFDPLWSGTHRFPTYESNVVFTLRYLVDAQIGGANWITIPKGKFSLALTKLTTAQLQVVVSAEDITAHPAEGKYMQIAPYRILSLDIECQGRKGCFPEAEKDPVIQIG